MWTLQVLTYTTAHWQKCLFYLNAFPQQWKFLHQRLNWTTDCQISVRTASLFLYFSHFSPPLSSIWHVWICTEVLNMHESFVKQSGSQQIRKSYWLVTKRHRRRLYTVYNKHQADDCLYICLYTVTARAMHRPVIGPLTECMLREWSSPMEHLREIKLRLEGLTIKITITNSTVYSENCLAICSQKYRVSHFQ